jgi:hypothetical protein
MFDISVPNIIGFDSSKVTTLSESIVSLKTINEVFEWDKNAAAEIELLKNHVNIIERKLQQISSAIIVEKQKHDAKSFFSKIFDNEKEKKYLLEKHNKLSVSRKMIEKTVEDLSNAIAFTPDSVDDVKTLIKECRNSKKELQIQKKSINSEMTSIRVEARQKSVNTMYGKYGKWDRRMIQLNKESALQPKENKKAAIERQIIKIDQLELWLERFL